LVWKSRGTARAYNRRVFRGGYLVIINGTDEEIGIAQVTQAAAAFWGIYDAPGVESARTGTTTPKGGIAGMPVADPPLAPRIQIIPLPHLVGLLVWL